MLVRPGKSRACRFTAASTAPRLLSSLELRRGEGPAGARAGTERGSGRPAGAASMHLRPLRPGFTTLRHSTRQPILHVAEVAQRVEVQVKQLQLVVLRQRL